MCYTYYINYFKLKVTIMKQDSKHKEVEKYLTELIGKPVTEFHMTTKGFEFFICADLVKYIYLPDPTIYGFKEQWNGITYLWVDVEKEVKEAIYAILSSSETL